MTLTARTDLTVTVGFNRLTPAEQGILVEAINTARDMGKGDDDIVDHVANVLQSECGMDEKTAGDVAYDAWHS